MPLILLPTFIRAAPQTVFDLARNIDLHNNPDSPIGEKAVAGRTTGLIGLHETVTWKGRPFGITMKLTTQVKEMRPPAYFRDEQVKGPFGKFRHEHLFEEKDGGTLMTDRMLLESPLGLVGKMADAMFVERYMIRFLQIRNARIKRLAEMGLPGKG
jgi:ligand-binding SRPBCC domain-containing protein